jgi:hypothetical protein
MGVPAGLIIKMGGLTIYDAGDTCLFGDMELIGRRHHVDSRCCRSAAIHDGSQKDAAMRRP